MRSVHRQALLLGLFAGVALLNSGCEIGLLVAAVAGDDETDPYGGDYAYCNETSGPDAGYSGLSGKNNEIAVYGQSFSAPLERLALGERYNFFVVAAGHDPGPDFTLDVGGVLERTDTSQGACATWYGDAASFVSFDTKKAGKGSITVIVSDDELDHVDFEVAEPKEIQLSFNSSTATVHADLRDADDRSLYSFSGISWEVAGPGPSTTPVSGPDSPSLFASGANQEIIVLAFYGDLSASITLVSDANYTLHPK